jgi:predicted Zn-dependent protease
MGMQMMNLRRFLVTGSALPVLTLSLLIAGRGACLAGAPLAFREAPRRWENQPGAPRQIERLRHVMLPLLRATDHPQPLNEVRVGIVEDKRINAATSGGGIFYVTTGLLDRATDNQLRGVLAHEIAHEDLGHPARAQMLTAGLSLGAALLERLFPRGGAVAPLAGMLLTSHYSQPQEYEADRQAVRILGRAGYGKQIMIDALAWIMQVEGDNGGGFLSTHPATRDRIRALRQLA